MKPLITLLAAAMITGLAWAAPRTWTATDGRTIEGELIAKTEMTATIKRTDATVVTVPLALLIEKDKAFIAKAKIKTIKAELTAFFSTEEWISQEQSQAGASGGAFGDPFQQTIKNNGAGWLAMFAKLETYNRDMPDDKRLMNEIRTATSAIKKAMADKTQSGEAFRAMLSLKTAALK